MFSNTAYEALYQYIGLALHSQFIEVMTSETFFRALLIIIFAAAFFMTTVKFFSRYMPATLVRHERVPLAVFAKLVFWLFMGLAILRVGSTTGVKNFKGEDWGDSSYIKSQYGDVAQRTKVSFIFDIMSRSAEEIAAYIGKIVDQVMGKEHSQLAAPNYFFKAIMYSASATIEDPELRDATRYYTEACFERILPVLKAKVSEDSFSSIQNKIFPLFWESSAADDELAKIEINDGGESAKNCLDLKRKVKGGLKSYAQKVNHKLSGNDFDFKRATHIEEYENFHISNMLVNFYLEDKESSMGIMKGSELNDTSGQVMQFLNRVFSFDAVLSFLGLGEGHGISEAASRAQSFSEHLARAPHVAGFIKMLLIGCFPFLIFFVVAGRWKPLLYWYVIYFSVLMWQPLWVFMYHIMVNLAQSAEYMNNMKYFNDGISLYGAKLVASRMYYFYSIYSWLQLLVATMTTGTTFYFLKPMLSENNQESAPDFVDDGMGVASTVARVL